MSKAKKKKKPTQPVRISFTISQTRKRETSSVPLNSYPIIGCWITKTWKEEGMASVAIARQAPIRIIAAFYLVDLYCLGVKDAFTIEVHSLRALEKNVAKAMQGEEIPISPALAHEIVYGSIEFARKYGFEPHPDFYRLKANEILDPPDAYPHSGEVVFGYQGKPFYVAGPYDSPAKIAQILSTLERTAPGEYIYLPSYDPGDEE